MMSSQMEGVGFLCHCSEEVSPWRRAPDQQHSLGVHVGDRLVLPGEATGIGALCYSTSAILTDTIQSLISSFIQQVLIRLL